MDGLPDTFRNAPLIHVGLPKAASTFIKTTYFSRMTRNLVVPRGQLFERLLAAEFDAEAWRRQLADQLDGPDRLIVSNENLSGWFWDADHAETVARNLHAALPEARVLLVLREQVDYLRSAYAFCLTKAFHVPRLDRLVRRQRLQLLKKFDYASLVQCYRRVFGPDRVAVLAFEQLRARREEFVEALQGFCGSMELRYPGPPSRRNASVVGRTRLETLRRVNLLMQPAIRLQRAGKRLLGGRHSRLRSRWEHLTIQDAVVAGVNALIPADPRPPEIPDEFMTEAEPIIRASNRRLAAMVDWNPAALGYLCDEAAAASPHEKTGT